MSQFFGTELLNTVITKDERLQASGFRCKQTTKHREPIQTDETADSFERSSVELTPFDESNALS